MRDAAEVLIYALSTGKPVNPSVIRQIRAAEASVKDGQPWTVDQQVAFDLAYRSLTALVHPVTAETLRDTEKWPGGVARQHSTRLWLSTLAFLLLVLVGEVFARAEREAVSLDDLTDAFRAGSSAWWKLLLAQCAPFAYGGLGASAFLLRALHRTVWLRCFDPRRQPEYWNRVLLGFVSGGMVNLAFTSAADFHGDQLTAAGLAFVVGYNNDVFFVTLERIVTAFFPKVAPQQTPANQPPPPTPPAADDQERPPPDEPRVKDDKTPGRS